MANNKDDHPIGRDTGTPMPARAVGEPATLLRSVCVYCGSGLGSDPAFAQAATELGRSLAQAGVGLVYGGGSIGLMGVVARAVLAAGGHVTGIIPDFLSRREHLLPDVQETHVVADMHTRKRMMFEKADAFVALPGGIGTLEELVEQMTWAQLGRHAKPVLLVNVGGFWQPLIDCLAHMRQYGFLRPGLEADYLVATEAAEVLPCLRAALSRRVPVEPEIVEAIGTKF